jgi:5-(carboxyamino)imidazole ribonucleotide mutase
MERKHTSSAGPLAVAILMGSDSDWEVMEPAAARLREFGVPVEVHVRSAHRMPEETAHFARTARARGFGAIIAGAGAAAHLAGVVASHTTLPVIGVPIDSSPLRGLDALLATAQMPGGIPVATVAIGRAGAENAGILAAEILAVRDAGLARKLEAFKAELAAKGAEKDARLQRTLAGAPVAMAEREAARTRAGGAARATPAASRRRRRSR